MNLLSPLIPVLICVGILLIYFDTMIFRSIVCFYVYSILFFCLIFVCGKPITYFLVLTFVLFVGKLEFWSLEGSLYRE